MSDTNKNRLNPSNDVDTTIGFVGDDEILSDGYTVVWNYFLNKWCPILGVGPSMLYIQILKRCFRDTKGNQKDDAFPKVSTLCKELGIKSRTTLHKWLDLLEDYDFITKFNRYNTEENGKMLQTSNLYKVRLNIHLTPEEKQLKEQKTTVSTGVFITEPKRSKALQKEIRLLAQEISSLFKCNKKEILNIIKDCDEPVIRDAFKTTISGMNRENNKVYNPKAFFESILVNMKKNTIENTPKSTKEGSSKTIKSHSEYAKRFEKLE